MLSAAKYQVKLFWFFTFAMMSVALIIMAAGYLMSKKSTVQKMEQSATQELALKKEIVQKLTTHSRTTLALSKRPHIVSLLNAPYEALSCSTEFFYLSAAHLGNDLLQMHYVDFKHKRVVHVRRDTMVEKLNAQVSTEDYDAHVREFDALMVYDPDRAFVLAVFSHEGKQPYIRTATPIWDSNGLILGVISLDLDMRNALKTVVSSELFDIVVLDKNKNVIDSSFTRLAPSSALVNENEERKELLSLIQTLSQTQGILWRQGYVYVSDTLLSESGAHMSIVLRSKNNLSEITQGITKIFSGILVLILMISLLLSLALSKLHSALLTKIIIREELLLQEGKLVEIGGMISYLAHQWKQPINRIASRIACAKGEVLHVRPLKHDVLLNDLDSAEEELTQMAEHIETFRTFYRFSKEKELFGVEKELGHIAQMLSYALHMQHIRLHVSAHSTNIELYGLKNEWKHAIVSLLNNAIEAFASSHTKDNALIRIDISQNATQTIVMIEDNAGGIEEKLQPQLFSKYASSKQATGGTGLGLYFTQMIVEERFHGTISIANTTDGTCFTLTFPTLS